jgi:hypothetical protein
MIETFQKINSLSHAKTMYYKTLVGIVHKHLKKIKQASTDELLVYIKSKEIVRPTGQKYEINDDIVAHKSLLGITSTHIFNLSRDIWTLNEERAREYKSEKVKKYSRKYFRTNTSLPLLPKASKLLRNMQLIHSFTLEMKSKDQTKDLFINPFKILDGDENIIQAGAKIGKDQLIGMIEGYLITSKYCKYYVVSKIIEKKYRTSSFEILDKLEVIDERLKKVQKKFRFK